MAKKKKAPRKKSAKKVGGDDDSEVDASGDSVKKRKAGGGFQKPFNLSDTLSALCGETQVRIRFYVSFRGHSANTAMTIAFPSSSRQEAVGAHQGQRSPRPRRQAPDPLRREDAGCFQAGQSRHVPDEQGYWKPSLPR